MSTLSLTYLSAAALCLVLLGCAESKDPPTVYVPASWKEHRKGEGHVEHLNADVQCRECHQVEGSGFKTVSYLICDDCHDVRDRMHVSHSAPKSACQECHSFKENSEVSRTGCVRCHEGSQAKKPAIHEKDCASCHRTHATRTVAVPACTKCHEPIRTEIHTAMGPDPRACTSCHSMHKKEMTCLSCHAEKADARVKGHERCIDCHQPHGPPPVTSALRNEKQAAPPAAAASRNEKPAPLKDCTSCHEKATKLRHDQCVDCHDPHAIAQNPLDRCERCHSDVLVDHQPEDRCATCHGGHELRSGTKACTACHKNAPTDRGLHAGQVACSKCHGAHQFIVEATTTECAACHQVEARTSAKRDGHEDCDNCHLGSAHTPSRSTEACAKCHVVERKTAPRGHEACALCHEPHAGTTAQRACVSCHESPATHGNIQRCETCHTSHGPRGQITPPDCQSCHSTRPLLHASSGHRDCAKCHTAHGAPAKNDRPTCAACHGPMAEHEPTAQNCQGCHPFK